MGKVRGKVRFWERVRVRVRVWERVRVLVGDRANCWGFQLNTLPQWLEKESSNNELPFQITEYYKEANRIPELPCKNQDGMWMDSTQQPCSILGL